MIALSSEEKTNKCRRAETRREKMAFIVIEMEVKSVERIEELEEAAKRVPILATRNVSCPGLVDGHPDSAGQSGLTFLVKELLVEKIKEDGIDYTDLDGCFIQIASSQDLPFLIAVPASRFVRP